MLFLRSDLSIVGNLISVSVLGASIRIDSNSKFELDDEVELVCDSYRVRSRIIRLSKNDIILEFEKSVAGSLESRNFLIKALPSNIKIRQKDLYEQLLLLYQEVGYAPLTGDKYSSWKEESIHAWSLQDSVLHGNCTLGVINTSAQASLGTLPLSSRVIYGHSLCMVKTLEAANSLFEQLTYSLSWVNFLPDIQYYSGSYRKNSGFTTKLQTMYDLCGSPIDQIVVHTNQVISPSEEIKLDFQHFILESIQKTHDLKFSFPDRLKKTIELLETPHSSISNIHNIVKYVIRSSDENVPVAILLLSSAPKKFTAADIFRYIWLFKFESISKTEDIVKWILSQSEFRDFPIQLVDSESLQKSPEYNGPFKTVPAFWTFTPKDEIGTQISTMARAVYTILKKYGQSASDSLMRLC